MQVLETPSLVLAFAAGFVSFVSPCCLPLVPGYLATVAGVRPGESGQSDKARVLDPATACREADLHDLAASVKRQWASGGCAAAEAASCRTAHPSRFALSRREDRWT